ncbi:MAG: UDP-N-acetylmuramate--L-alanine ligase [Saprospiraceae bacterium]|nr:UDP-N-acetylmuramate--L-alanine ligase [Saprospiraceae bacterium]
MKDLDQLQVVYFVGIGGIGMSALARYFRHLGMTVYGYDRVQTRLTHQLSQEGMQIHYEDNPDLIPKGIDLVVYTPAIPATHQELSYFRANNYILKKRAEVLGIISKHRKTIGVAGTHGKTTTSSMLTHLLRESGIDCTAFLGGISSNLNSNFVAGNSEWVVMEADEFDRSFLHLHPHISIITSMDADHLDIYGDKDSLEATFHQYAQQTQEQLYHHHSLSINKEVNSDIQWKSYGIDAGEYTSTNIHYRAKTRFDYKHPDLVLDHLETLMPGKHNIENLTAAISVAIELGADLEALRKAIASFKGIQRRFEFVRVTDQYTFIDDYAHHPSELSAAIQATRALYPNRKITGIFQPHLYSRTQDFSAGFAKALDLLDEVILLDIYPARELPIEGVDSGLIYRQMKLKHKLLINKKELLATLKNYSPDVLLSLGAGDIGAMVKDIANFLDGHFIKK